MLWARKFFLAALLITLVSCSDGPPEALPSLPEVDTTGYLPIIRKQLEQAYAAVTNDPLDAEANGRLGQMLQSYAQNEPAATMYLRAAQLERKAARWRYLQGQSLAALGRPQEAIDALSHAHRLERSDPWIASAYTLMRRVAGDRDASAGDLDAVVKAHPELPELRYARAQLYALDGDLERATAEFERTLALTGPFGAAYYGLGMARLRLGDQKGAAEALALSRQYKDTRAQGSDPYLAEVEALNLSDIRLIQRAETSLMAGDLSTAATLLEQAVTRNPKSTAAHLSLMGVYSNLQQFDLAEAHYAAAKALEPERARLFHNLGIMRHLQQRYVEAERAFREALRRHPEDADTYVQLALTQQAQRQPMLARLSLTRAVELNPSSRFARLQLGRLLHREQDMAGVVRVLEGHYSPPDAGSTDLLLLLAKAYNARGERDTALARATLGLKLAQQFAQPSLINQFRRQQYLAGES